MGEEQRYSESVKDEDFLVNLSKDLGKNVLAPGPKKEDLLGSLPLSLLGHTQEDSLKEARNIYVLAKVFYDKSDLERARELFLKALSYHELFETKAIFLNFKILGFLVRICSEMMLVEESQLMILKSEELIDWMKEHLPVLTAEYEYDKGTVETYRGRFDSAQKIFLEAYLKSQKENAHEVMAKCLHALAYGHYQMREFDQALNYLSQLKELLCVYGKEYLKGSMHLLLGHVYREKEDYQNALLHYGISRKVLMGQGLWNLSPYIFLGESVTCKRMGDFPKALYLAQLALSCIDEKVFKRASQYIQSEIDDVKDSSVDLYLNRQKRIVIEKTKGVIDFKHRFVLLEILFLLAKNPGAPYDKEVLAENIWKDEYNPLIHDKLIYTSVSRLRKLIEPKETSEKRKYIIRGKDGYVFNPRVNVRFQQESHFSHVPGDVEMSAPA